MPSRSNSNLLFVDQGNFSLTDEPYDENYIPASKSLLTISQTYGLILVAHNRDVKALSFVGLEPHFAGDEEVRLPEESVLSSLSFNESICSIALSPDESKLAILTEKHMYIFSIYSFADQVSIV